MNYNLVIMSRGGSRIYWGRFTAWVHMRANMGPRPFRKTMPINGQQVRLHDDKQLDNSTFQVILV